MGDERERERGEGRGREGGGGERERERERERVSIFSQNAFFHVCVWITAGPPQRLLTLLVSFHFF